MWLMSDRGRPRSWRMMEAWPVNTFRFINADGKSTYVRFVWKPLLGVHSLLLEEANIIGGVDPDYHRRDLYEAIERGAYPEYELGVQLIPEGEEYNYDFDILDDTKLWPEEDVPVEIIGKLTLNRFVDNHFAEEEQVSFDPSTIVPGIDFTNDPVLQGRTFAYRDTDYHRLGTGNINEIPINKPINEVNSNERDSYSRYRIDVDSVNYKKNSLAGNTPTVTPPEESGYSHYPEHVSGEVTRENPGESFDDYFSQARMFWNSMSPVEKRNIIETFKSHLAQVTNESVRQQVVDMFGHVDYDMAQEIAEYINVNPPKSETVPVTKTSAPLSLANTPHYAYTQRVAVLIGDQFPEHEVFETVNVLEEHGAFIYYISDRLKEVRGDGGTKIEVTDTFLSTHPVLYDSLFVAGGTGTDETTFNEYVMSFISQMFNSYKPIGFTTLGEKYFPIQSTNDIPGLFYYGHTNNFPQAFTEGVAMQRFWSRDVSV